MFTGRENVLKELSIATTYKTISCPILNNEAPVWTVFVSDTKWKDLQARQNNVLQTATHCMKMTGIDCFSEETKILPVKPLNALLSVKFLAACHLPDKPNNDLTTKRSLARIIKQEICQ